MSESSTPGESPSQAPGQTPSQTWVHEFRGHLEQPSPRRLPKDAPGRAAAVLVPTFVEAGQLWLLLTKRAESLSNHAGQISFPGGGREAGEDAWQTALRETEEEIGLPPTRVLELGRLDEIYAEVSDYRIVPCVGAIPNPIEPELNEEVEEVLRVPLLAFADVKVVEDRVVQWRGEDRQIRIYHVGRHPVWGLTARIVQNLLQRLGLDLPGPE
jgi:8-oxo-dGTP pyrophosphatase MutT (NUDIX family)